MTPNWFAAVMGTGIVAVVAAAFPAGVPVARTVAEIFWLIAVTLLAGLTTALARHWIVRRDDALADARSHTMFPFYGAVAMAVLTVGAATGSAGHELLGGVAVAVAAILWTIGTALGLVTFAVMARRLTRPHQVAPAPSWLMPVVPPMVSAATGSALVRHLAEGAPRIALLMLCYALFALALSAALTVAAVVGSHLVRNGLPDLPLVPTLWIPLGVIGQSVAAINLLGGASGQTWLHSVGVVYGTTVGALGVVTLATLVTVTVGAFRRGLTFAPSWWSFTFPVGTCALGANSLGVALDSVVVVGAGVTLWCALLLIWGTVAVNTLRHAAGLLGERVARDRVPAYGATR
ncbi:MULTISPECIES: TDT family transporter [unclassified Rhodococcus (in: high G+C Gram-positive bacteria)]|uniref:TDT family transporter n=1 Tax=unclassified Rhodococcus (in: high G+C Gram-positive bacteria) TaxID=192944 RepID=UPI00163A1175|nr:MULTISPECIES: TDT family transporter [unclassified Rhodococcus (in: high G+C Gram-positive bacteria)]MBC2643442.1 TDT family transporter [Rhodococcus sp. 3A]MBC2891818.1 TDT family transporter [Rhodococcus sp. 4CII]